MRGYRLPGGLLVVLGCLLGGCAAQQVEKDQAVDHYARSQLLACGGDLDAALAELSEAVKADPTLSIAYASAGDIYRHRGNYWMASRSYESACLTNPYAFRCHYNLGWTYQRLAEACDLASGAQELLAKAIQVYLRAVALQPGDFDTKINLSACYYQTGKLDLAEKYCRDAIAIDPDNPAAYGNLGIICGSQDRLYEAVRTYKDSLERDPHQPKTLLNLGSTFLRLGQLKAACQSFTLATDEDPSDAVAQEHLGACLCRMKEYEKSLSNYRRAIELNPASANAHRGLGVVLMSCYLLDPTKDAFRDEALVAWNRSLELQPDQEDLVDLVRKYTPKLSMPQM